MRSVMRLVIVGPLPPPPGGMANQTQQLSRLLAAEGLVVEVVRTNSPYRPAWIANVRGLRAGIRLGPYLRGLWAAIGRADVVHVMANSGLAWDLFAAPAIRVAKARKRPVVVNYRGGLAADFLQSAGRRVRRTLRGTRLVVPSNYLVEVFAQHGVAAEVIPNVVDTQVFHPGSESPRQRDPSAPHVVVPRNLERIYGIDLALHAVAQLTLRFPHLQVSIAGSGPELAALEALTESLGVRGHVRFTGRLDVGQMVQLYRSADLVLNPVRVDNTPNSLLEAMACGVPVVSTRVGGVPFLVEHGKEAYLVEPESPATLADGVTAVLEDGALRQQLRANGLRRAEACSWPVVREQWLGVYRGARA